MLIKTEFNKDEDSFYFLYVTDEVRIETDGVAGLTIEDRSYNKHSITDPIRYLTIEDHQDEYFQTSLVEPHLTTIIEAVKELYRLLEQE